MPRVGSAHDLGARYTRLAGYLVGLPDGLDSYPQCVARSGVLEAVLAAAPGAQDRGPPLVAALLAPPLRPWTQEVVLQAALLAVADHAGMTEARFLQWCRSTNRQLYRNLVYRALMAFLSPLTLLERGAARWSSFHHGTTLEVGRDGEKVAQGQLTFPPGLFTPFLLRGYAEAFAAAFEHSRAENVSVELARTTETSARFVVRWS